MATEDFTPPAEFEVRGVAQSINEAARLYSEIRDKNDRILSLAYALLSRLHQNEERDSYDNVALRLAELLVELMDDSAPESRLMNCLTEMQTEVAHV